MTAYDKTQIVWVFKKKITLVFFSKFSSWNFIRLLYRRFLIWARFHVDMRRIRRFVTIVTMWPLGVKGSTVNLFTNEHQFFIWPCCMRIIHFKLTLNVSWMTSSTKTLFPAKNSRNFDHFKFGKYWVKYGIVHISGPC